MGIIRVPRVVADKLLNEETVLRKYETRAADYYVTNKRLLRFKSESKYAIIANTDVSIKLVKYGIGWKIFVFFTVLLGLLLIGLGIVIYLDQGMNSSTSISGYSPLFPDFLLPIFSWIGGAFTIVVALTFRYAYYQFEAPGIDQHEIKKWRIDRLRWGGGGADKFVRVAKSTKSEEVA